MTYHENSSLEAWVIIPARGGSVGIPRKNIRLLNGQPLIKYTIRTALELLPQKRVIVVTDDDEIAQVAEESGASVILEVEVTPPEETLDTKIVRNIPNLRKLGASAEDVIVTVQPTSPLLSAETLQVAIDFFAEEGVRSVLSVVDDQHLRWRLGENGAPVATFSSRVNRQQLPQEFRETGGVIAARLGDIEAKRTRVIAPVSLLPMSAEEALDIDDFSDLYAAAHLLSRRRIVIRVDASRQMGMGHVYRMLSLASELARHDLVICLKEQHTLGHKFFANYPYKTVIVQDEDEFCERVSEFRPDLIVLDKLDTTAAEIVKLRRSAPEAKIITFEDGGSGAAEADLLVAEFIENDQVADSHQLAGIDYALLSPSFEIGNRASRPFLEKVENVLVLFGGTDPSGLAARAVRSLKSVGFDGHVTVVRGLGAPPISFPDTVFPFELRILENVKNMAVLMSQTDVAFTSAGRTVIELLSRGVPAICLAQNEKELTHTHATEANGVMALGLGAAISDEAFAMATRRMLNDHELRKKYALRARETGSRRNNRKTIATILSKVGFEDFPEI